MARSRLLIAAPLFLLLGGCAQPPSIVVFGAAFPDWLFCILAGVLGTTAFHLLLGRLKLQQHFSPLALSYSAMMALLSMLCWLIVFSR